MILPDNMQIEYYYLTLSHLENNKCLSFYVYGTNTSLFITSNRYSNVLYILGFTTTRPYASSISRWSLLILKWITKKRTEVEEILLVLQER